MKKLIVLPIVLLSILLIVSTVACSSQSQEVITYCASGCQTSWLGDGTCQSICNNAACSYDNGDCGSTPQPTLAPTVLFSDDFSDPYSGWDTYDYNDGEVGYENGYYYVQDSALYHGTMYGEIHRYLSDFILEIDTWLIGGTDNNWHTVSCRAQNEYNNYDFGISADGYYAILKYVNEVSTPLSGPDPIYSSYINQGVGSVNRIHIECIGNSLSFSVNGHLLKQVTDNSFSSGGIIYLTANALEGTFTKVAYDNLVITEP